MTDIEKLALIRKYCEDMVTEYSSEREQSDYQITNLTKNLQAAYNIGCFQGQGSLAFRLLKILNA